MPRPVRHLLSAALCLVAAACAPLTRAPRPDRDIAAGSTACELQRLLIDTTLYAHILPPPDDSAHAATVKRLSAAADSIMADTALQARRERLIVDTALYSRFVSVSLQLDSLLADLKRCPPRRPS
jgi:hypothetical protein